MKIRDIESDEKFQGEVKKANFTVDEESDVLNTCGLFLSAAAQDLALNLLSLSRKSGHFDRAMERIERAHHEVWQYQDPDRAGDPHRIAVNDKIWHTIYEDLGVPYPEVEN